MRTSVTIMRGKKPANGNTRRRVVRMLTIGEMARVCGVTPRAIRHYETLGLLAASARGENNYRLFDKEAETRMRFIARCRALGFSIPEIADLLKILGDPNRTCAQVANISRQHLELIDAKLHGLMSMRREVETHLSRCSDENVPDCAVLDYLTRTT